MTKLEELKQLIETNQYDKAIKMAAKFPRLGEERNAILSASSALLSPNMYISMGKNPEKVIQDGITAIINKYL
jgi:hypothetical protein